MPRGVYKRTKPIWNKGTKGVMKSNSTSFKKGNVPWTTGRGHTKESIEKMSLAKRGKYTGKNHWNWKGGITPPNRRIRHSIEFRLWRESVFARDNFTCQKCGKIGVYLQPHHIKNFAEYPELRFAIDNGITFCKDCHMSFHKTYGRKNNTENQVLMFGSNRHFHWSCSSKTL